MTPANGLHGQSQRAPQRPLYVASPASQHIPTKAASTPIRSMSSTSSAQQNSLASPSTPYGRSTGDIKSQHSIATPAAARRSQASPSAYDRFDEVSWIVDLSSRIGNALQSPPRSSAKASAIGSQSPAASPAHLRTRNRVRLPRPSREFRDLQHKIQLSHASTSASALADTGPDLSASFDPDDSAVEWAQHAQQDFERRRADLERSRQAILKHLEGDDQHGDADDEEQASEAIAKASVDPAVERSMLAARSLQELTRSGGLQNEDGDDPSPGFADLLANAEPLPGGAELGPSSLFEANRGSDGTLDIESILQQRAKMAALTDHEQEGPSRPKASMFNLSQSASKPPPKRPVIEILGADNSRPATKAKTSSEDADQELAHGEASKRAHSSDQSSSESSSESDGSSSSEDSDSESDEAAEAVAGTVQARSGEQQNAAPHPMDQIAIVNGEFRILPAAHPERTLSQQQSPDLDGDHTAASSADEDSDQDDHMDSASDDQASDDAADDDEDDEMDDDGEHGYAADPAQNRYHDGFGGVSTRNLLFDGPVGDADEPIVLSDSDEDDDAGEDQDNRDQDEEEEMDEDNQDQLADESEEEQQSDEDAQPHYGRPQLAAAPLSDDEHEHEEEEDKGEEEDLDDSQEAIGQFHPPAPSIPLDANRTLMGLDQDGTQQLPLSSTPAPAPTAPDASQGKTSLQQGDSDDSDQEGDAMPDSEVEPEEFDEDLRWSDMEAEAEQPNDQEPPYAQLPASTSVDAAFRASQGSQPMPGFVTASQLFANIQAAESEADAQRDFSVADALQTAGPIDPQLLASLPGDQQMQKDAVSTEVEAAAAAETRPLPADTSPTQTDADIFDAFTRQDTSSSSAQEPHATETAEAVPTLQANSEESHDDVGAEDVTGDAAIEESPVIARTDASEQPEQVVSEALDRSDDAPETEDLAPQTEDPTERAKVEEQNGDAVHSPRPIGATEDTVSAIAGASELSASQGQAALPVELQAEDIPAAVETSADADDEGMDEPIELIKPVLARVESTDVLEADVEDNSEDEAAIEETAAPGSDSVPPLSTAALSADPTSEVLVVEADDISRGGSHASATGGEQPAEAFIEPVALEVSQPHIIIDAHEEEGILSGDLADRDSSIERQPLPSSTATSRVSAVTKDEKIDEHALEDALHTESQLSSTSGAPVEPEKAGSSSVQDEHVTGRDEELVEHTDPPMMEDSLPQTAESGPEVTHTPTEPSTVSGSKGSDVSVTASLSTLLPNRVPPSPASSDRRSGSSFTPSANRQGNRHLHGAAKRNLFAQMTEAASNLASNLTAPLRAIPSLLPISESQAEESRADDRDVPTTSTAEDNAQDSGPVGSQGQQKRTTKSSDASEYTITTRSHCICRRLQLNKIEGAPIFIVPGCSINYEEARLEDAEDLGKTSEQKSNDWIDVDPDFLPPDVHHMLSRIIGLQMMCEICVEPDSTAAKMIFAGFDLDADPLTSFDDDDKERIAKHNSTGDETLAKAEVGGGAEAKEPETEINVEAGAIEETHQEDPETPSHIARQSPRHRRASSVASASSHHRSPRRSDPMSANADYLPDDERRILQKGRHPQAAAPGDVSIASLEEQVQDEEDEDDADLDARILPKAEHSAEEGEGRDVEEEPTSLISPPQEPKRKRGRPRKSAAADTSYKPSAQDAQEADEDDAEPSAEPKPRKGRGRKRAASEDASGKAQASDNKDAQDAAAVEDVLDAVASTPKRGRRGRKSRDTAAFDPREGQQSEDEEKEGTENTGSPVRTRATRDNEGAVQQQVRGEDEEGSKLEAEEKSKARKGGRGGRKRKQAADESSNAAAEASVVDKVAKTGEGQTAKQPRRSRRSQGGSQTPSTSPSKTSPRKSPKRKVLKLN